MNIVVVFTQQYLHQKLLESDNNCWNSQFDEYELGKTQMVWEMWITKVHDQMQVKSQVTLQLKVMQKIPSQHNVHNNSLAYLSFRLALKT